WPTCTSSSIRSRSCSTGTERSVPGRRKSRFRGHRARLAQVTAFVQDERLERFPDGEPEQLRHRRRQPAPIEIHLPRLIQETFELPLFLEEARQDLRIRRVHGGPE